MCYTDFVELEGFEPSSELTPRLHFTGLPQIAHASPQSYRKSLNFQSLKLCTLGITVDKLIKCTLVTVVLV